MICSLTATYQYFSYVEQQNKKRSRYFVDLIQSDDESIWLRGGVGVMTLPF